MSSCPGGDRSSNLRLPYTTAERRRSPESLAEGSRRARPAGMIYRPAPSAGRPWCRGASDGIPCRSVAAPTRHNYVTPRSFNPPRLGPFLALNPVVFPFVDIRFFFSFYLSHLICPRVPVPVGFDFLPAASVAFSAVRKQ